MNELAERKKYWAPVAELSRILAAEREGFTIDRHRLRELAESLRPQHPEIKVTLSSICARLA